ncbi:hypothetical protein SSP35_01_03720 [Streptomyces sp. NBRC 110611]|nr:hypothetical protein SSP35_01_03720 [Streptomyces sp. NBRC 110611]
MTAAPASAGGVIEFLSPAAHNACAHKNTGAHNTGHPARGSGTVTGNFAEFPLLGSINQCGGADLPNLFRPQQVRSEY